MKRRSLNRGRREELRKEAEENFAFYGNTKSAGEPEGFSSRDDDPQESKDEENASEDSQ